MALRLDLEVAVRRHPRLLLDTSVLIDEFKRQSTVLVRIPRPQRATSPVAVWEFVHLNDGRLIAHAERLARKAWMDRQQIESVWFAPGSAQSFQTLLWHASCPPGVADCLLAAESLCRKWPLVTRNTKHFDDVQGMLVVPY